MGYSQVCVNVGYIARKREQTGVYTKAVYLHAVFSQQHICRPCLYNRLALFSSLDTHVEAGLLHALACLFSGVLAEEMPDLVVSLASACDRELG